MVKHGCRQWMEGSRMAARPDRDSAVTWRKSRASSGGGECVEVARLGRSVLVRDSRNRLGGALALTTAQWRALLVTIRNGDLDRD
jgi:hypothetical protein